MCLSHQGGLSWPEVATFDNFIIHILVGQCNKQWLHLQIKAEDCLKLEEERVSSYMHQSSRTSLLKEVETEILQQHQTTLLEKEQSGCAALLQDDKVTTPVAPLLCHAAHLKLLLCVSHICYPMTMQHPGCSTPVKAMMAIAIRTGCIILDRWCYGTQRGPCLSQCFVNTTKRVGLLHTLMRLCMLQKSDLARMYRLFQRIPKGLEPVAESFKKHVESEGMKLVKEATEAATAKKDKDAGKPSKDSGTAHLCIAAKAPSTVQVDGWSCQWRCLLKCTSQ